MEDQAFESNLECFASRGNSQSLRDCSETQFHNPEDLPFGVNSKCCCDERLSSSLPPKIICPTYRGCALHNSRPQAEIGLFLPGNFSLCYVLHFLARQ